MFELLVLCYHTRFFDKLSSGNGSVDHSGEYGRRLESFILREAQHQVHILYGLTGGSLNEVVDYRYDDRCSVMGVYSQSYVGKI